MATQEDLASLAPLAFAGAGRMCGICRDYHATWVYRRIAGTVGGVESDRPTLVPLIRDLRKHRALRQWMIAGTADSGITATVAMSLDEDLADAHFTIVDRCETPLVLCRAFAQGAGLSAATVKADLETYTTNERCDAVIAHSVLGFFPKERQPRLLERLRNVLRPQGALIFCTRLFSSSRKENNAEHELRTIAAIYAAVAAGRLVLPNLRRCSRNACAM